MVNQYEIITIRQNLREFAQDVQALKPHACPEKEDEPINAIFKHAYNAALAQFEAAAMQYAGAFGMAPVQQAFPGMQQGMQQGMAMPAPQVQGGGAVHYTNVPRNPGPGVIVPAGGGVQYSNHVKAPGT